MENSQPLRCKAYKTKISELKPPPKNKAICLWQMALFLGFAARLA